MRLKLNRRFALFGVRWALTLVLLPLSHAAQAAPEPDVVSFATSPEGTTGYIISTGYTAMLTVHTSIKKVVMQPFASASAWPARMNTGEVAFAQHCGFQQVMEAYTGTGPFKQIGAQRNVRNLATLYGTPWSVHVLDPKARTPADLKGKSIFVLVAHTDHVIALETMLKESNLVPKRDVRILPLRSPTEAIQGLSTGRGDGFAFALVPAMVELKEGKGLNSISISPTLAQKVIDASPVWGRTVIRKGTGPLQPTEDVPALEIECGLAASANISEQRAYEVIRAIYDKHEDWKRVHPLADQATLKKAMEIFVVPFHDGAVRFFKEKGMWTAEHEARQKQLLSN